MENLHSYRCTAEQNRLYLPYYHDLCSLWRKGTVPPMKGRMKPYLPELTIRDYNIYLQYLRGVRRQLYTEFGWYSCHLLRYNGVVFAILSDSLAGRTATCQRQRVPGTRCWRRMMCQTQGIRQAAQVEVLLGWHNLQDRRPDEVRPAKRLRRALDRVLLRRAYERVVQQNPALERLFGQERDQAVVQMNLNAKNYNLAAEPASSIHGAVFHHSPQWPQPSAEHALHQPAAWAHLYLMDRPGAEAANYGSRYNVFVVNDLMGQASAVENARRQALAAANDLMRVYSMLDVKLNRSLLDSHVLLSFAPRGGTAGSGRRAGKLGDPMKKQNRKSWTMAYCGMAAALCVALMLLGAVIPIAMFSAPALAGFLIATVCVECGRTMALTAYAAVSLTALTCRTKKWP